MAQSGALSAWVRIGRFLSLPISRSVFRVSLRRLETATAVANSSPANAPEYGNNLQEWVDIGVAGELYDAPPDLNLEGLQARSEAGRSQA